MINSVTDETQRRRVRRRALMIFGLAALVAAAGLAMLTRPGTADSNPSVIRTLGQLPNQPQPACPATGRRACMAVGNVTVFQTAAAGTRMPYQVPFHGRLVSWSITLAKPERSEIRGFNEFYGRPSQARIAVLRPVSARPPVFKMVRQSPAQELNRFFGRTAHFALERPLVVRRGHIVALTIPTWAPNWAINLSGGNTWRASRSRNRCSDADIEDHSRPQQRVGSDRQYGCFFSNTRFLYTATIVREPGR